MLWQVLAGTETAHMLTAPSPRLLKHRVMGEVGEANKKIYIILYLATLMVYLIWFLCGMCRQQCRPNVDLKAGPKDSPWSTTHTQNSLARIIPLGHRLSLT